MALSTRWLIAAICLSLLGSVPGGAALAAACCLTPAQGVTAGPDSHQWSNGLAAARHTDHGRHEHGTKVPAGRDGRPHGGPDSEVDRGLPLTADQDGPDRSYPVCGLTACAQFPQASLLTQAWPGPEAAPASSPSPEAALAQGSVHPDSIYHPPRA